MNNNLISGGLTSSTIYNNNPHHMPSISGNKSGFDDQSDRQSVYSMNSNPFYPN